MRIHWVDVVLWIALMAICITMGITKPDSGDRPTGVSVVHRTPSF